MVRMISILVILGIIGCQSKGFVGSTTKPSISLSAATTQSGLQALLTKAGLAEPNLLDGTHANRAGVVELTGDLTLTGNGLKIYGNTTLRGTGSGATIRWSGEAPMIHFACFAGHGYTSDIRIENITFVAPNSSAIWDWPQDLGATGNVHHYFFKDCMITAKDVCINLMVPGDRRAYSFWFQNIKCWGTGSAIKGCAITGDFDRIISVNRELGGRPEIEFTDDGSQFKNTSTCLITNSWFEDRGASCLLKVTGNYGLIRWLNNHNEMSGDFRNGMVIVDGATDLLVDNIYFIQPQAPVVLKGGAAFNFTGNAYYQRNDGWNPPNSMPFDHQENGRYILVDLLNQCFKFGDPNSIMTFSRGKVDQYGVTADGKMTQVQPIP